MDEKVQTLENVNPYLKEVFQMIVQEAVEHYKEYQKSSVKKRTRQSYENLVKLIQEVFRDRDIESIKAEEVCRFLETHTEGLSRSTRRLRYAQLKALFNFADPSIRGTPY